MQFVGAVVVIELFVDYVITPVSLRVRVAACTFAILSLNVSPKCSVLKTIKALW